jgi:hypothetical protein
LVSSMARNGDSTHCAVICASPKRTLMSDLFPATSLIKGMSSMICLVPKSCAR